MYFQKERGFLSVVYLDDFLLIGSSYEQCLKTISVLLSTLFLLGFILNKNKSVITPAKFCHFLGLILDTEHFAISIPLKKWHKLLQRTLTVLHKKSCKIRFWTSYIGFFSFYLFSRTV